MFFKPISISLSPNTEKDDIWIALKLIFQPWKWKRGRSVEELENKFKEYLKVRYTFSFNSGRSSLMAILKSLDLDSQSEVLLQAFTCNAAINPIFWSDLKPVYVDCNEDDFNMDIGHLRKKISPDSKVLMVQHTFGLPAQMDEIEKIAKENNLILIEDCAHSLGAEYQGKKVGTFGKVAFFSFSRDKIISSVYGGIVVTNDEILAQKIKNFQEKVNYPSFFWIFQQLLHPVLMNFLILPTYRFLGLGKIILILFQRIHILSKAVHWKEKRGKRPRYFPKKMPNSLALLALNQFNKLEKFNNHRKRIADFYFNKLRNLSFMLPKIFPERKNIFLRFAFS